MVSSTEVSTAPPDLELRHLTKTFGDVVANRNVSFQVAKHSIHGVVGENGAGKSTIMKTVYGLYQPDAGEIWVRGKLEVIPSPQAAIKLGIGMVHQHFMLVPTLTVWQNIILGQEPHPFRLDRKYIIPQLQDLQYSFGFSLDLNAKVENLSVGSQQQVEILKALYRQAEILILDEPTAVLTPQETDVLLERLRALWQRGKTIILISHKLREILRFTQNITVMRQGTAVDTVKTEGLNENTLGELIVGRQIGRLPTRAKPTKLEKVIEIKDLTVYDGKRKVLDKVTFEVRAGEILGIAGVTGNGQQELIEVIAQVRKKFEGSVKFLGKPVRPNAIYDVKQNGLSVVPPDRHREGLVMSFSVAENLLLGHHCEEEFTQGAMLSNQKIVRVGTKLIDDFDVRPRNLSLAISALSGGNQQKVIIAREMNREVKFCLACHPTRGVDIGAIEFIHNLFLKSREAGTGILLISSELEEVLALSDRILVIYDGKIVGETTREAANESQIGLWMTGVTP